MYFHKMVRIVTALISGIGAAIIIYYVVSPFASWYLTTLPAVGVDLYNSVTYASYHAKHFSLPWTSFKDIWYGGYPLMQDFPQLAFFAMVPFVKLFGAVSGVQRFAVAALFLQLFICFWLFLRLSKQFGLAIFLTILVFLSVNIYGALTWAGSIPSFASQLFFPLGLLVGVGYLERPQNRSLALMILATGLGILIHPLETATFIIPSLIILLLGGAIIARFSPLKLLSHLFVYGLGSLLAAFIFTYDFFVTLFIGRKAPPIFTGSLQSTSQGVSEEALAIAQFYKNQIGLLFTQTNHWLFVALGVAVIGFMVTFFFSRHKKRALYLIPFILDTLYTAAHPALNLADIISIFRHDPYRAFWPFPMALAALVAYFFGFAWQTLSNKNFTKWTGMLVSGVVSISLIFGAYFIFSQESQKTLVRIRETSELSSAFPEALSIRYKTDDLTELKKQLIPAFMDPQDKNKRLYTADAALNIWWNSLFDLPLARGYLDPPIGTDRRGGFFWLDIAIANDTIVRDFKISESQAYANSLFLLDWYAIHYFEGGRLGSKGPSPPASTYLLENNVFDKEEEITTYGAVLKYQTESGKPELHTDLPQHLKFFQVGEQFTSPILSGTTTPAVVVFTNFAGYEDILRLLAARNINSRKLIPVFADTDIDAFDSQSLKTFQAVILHQYKYKNYNKAFRLLEDYVKAGGKLFIDSGGDVKEADSNSLPEIFPMQKSQRLGQGRQWQMEVGSHELLQNVDTTDFGPLVFNDAEWKLTTPADVSLREGSTVLLKHKEKPVLIHYRLGQGEVVWSGINLPYHFNQYKTEAEAELFANILSKFVSISDHVVPAAETTWERPEKVSISTSEKINGILFKEQAYPGWKARLTSEGGKPLSLYLTGPTYPGFMYVPLENVSKFPAEVEFTYTGRPLYWFVAGINFLFVLLILDLVFLNGAIAGRKLGVLFIKVKRKISSWWEKEEE